MEKRLTNIINYLTYQKLVENDSDFAKSLGISKSRISGMKTGARPITKGFAYTVSTIFPCINPNYLIDENCDVMVNESSTQINGNGNFSTNSHSFNSTDQSDLIAQLRAENEHLKEQLAQARKDIEWLHDLVNALRSK